jgi:hypothetical protein
MSNRQEYSFYWYAQMLAANMTVLSTNMHSYQQ